MGMLYQVIEDKVDYLSENLEQGLRYIGKAMQCIDELKSGSMGFREDEDMDDNMMYRRRGMGRMGRRNYPRYREPFME